MADLKDIKVDLGAQLPGEQVLAAALRLFERIVERAPQDVADQYYRLALQDYMRWRAIWEKLFPWMKVDVPLPELPAPMKPEVRITQ